MEPLRGPMRNVPISRIHRGATASMVAAALCLTLAGCQGVSGPGASLASDPNDPCQQQRADFAASKNYFQDKIVTGAAIGAAVGAGAGALIGYASGGTAKSALTGGLIGGVVGGVGGAGTAYYNSLAERAADQNEIASDMNQDLARESQQIDHTAATFSRLRTCRFAQAKAIKAAVKRHDLDRTAGLTQIGYQRDRFEEELNVAHQFGLTMAKRGQQFQEAAADLKTPPAPAQGSAPQPASRSRINQVDRAASVSVPEKRASYDQKVASAEASKKAAFDLDSGGTLSWLLFLGFDA